MGAVRGTGSTGHSTVTVERGMRHGKAGGHDMRADKEVLD